MKQSQEEDKVVLTGGHAATTAIAVVEEIHFQKLPWDLYFIGSKYAVEGSRVTTLEYQSMPKYDVLFLPLVMGRLQRRFTVWTIPSLFKIPAGFFHAFYYLAKIKPRIVLSFGGFSSVPVVFVAWLMRIPVVIHEQTAAAGRANRAEGRFAAKIALSRVESEKYFPKKKISLTGNPVSKKFFTVKPKTGLKAMPTIFITGGSRGSVSINSVIAEALPDLLTKYKVVHQTGQIDEQKFVTLKKELPSKFSQNYEMLAKIEPAKIINYYSEADLIISRSGANTASEIMAVRRPAILIPLPISYLDEQTKNAQILADNGLALIIKQEELTNEILLEKVNKVFSNYKKYISAVNKFESPDIKASEKIVKLLEECIK